MATKNPRVNVSVDQSTREALSFLAKKNHQTLSGAARDLIIQALDLQEDRYFSDLVNERSKTKKKHKRYTHEEVCKKLGIK